MINKDVLSKILNVWDPIDVMVHAPRDEYHDFVDILYEYLTHGDRSIPEIMMELRTLVQEQFGMDTRYYDHVLQYVAELIDCCSNLIGEITEKDKRDAPES